MFKFLYPVLLIVITYLMFALVACLTTLDIKYIFFTEWHTVGRAVFAILTVIFLISPFMPERGPSWDD